MTIEKTALEELHDIIMADNPYDRWHLYTKWKEKWFHTIYCRSVFDTTGPKCLKFDEILSLQTKNMHQKIARELSKVAITEIIDDIKFGKVIVSRIDILSKNVKA